MIISSPLLSHREFLSTSFIQINNARFILSILCVLRIFWAIRCIPRFLQERSNKSLSLLILVLSLSLQMFFYIRKILILYIMFELSVIPIFGIIIGWGYQRERLNARLSLIFYTLTASMPFLRILLWMVNTNFCNNLNCVMRLRAVNLSSLSNLSIFCLIIAFAVKLPIFGVHIWLPKAHVEAPVFGSIVLASILLKLGRYGLWLFIPLVYSFKRANIWVSISIVGAVIISVICLRLRDLKIIIAYSSVRHIGLVLIALIIVQSLGAYGGLLLILAHGVRSSAIFLFSYFIYQANFSRRMILRKGVLVWSRLLPLLWFLILITNIAAPPTFNLVSEILIIRTIINLRRFNILPLVLIILLSRAYSFIIYRSTIQGTTILVNNNYVVKLSEIINTINHLIWGFLMVLAIGLINF